MFVSGIHSRHSFFGIPSIHSLLVPEAWASWERQYAPSAVHYACVMFIPSMQLKKQNSLMQKSREFGHGVVISKICYKKLYIDCAPLWLLQTNLLASAGWKWGCQPFSCWCSDVLFQESIPAILFWNSKHPLPTRTRSLSFRRAERSISSGLWLRHVHPFVAAAEKKQSHAEKQRVLPRSCRIEDLLRTIQWLCPKFGLQVFDCALRSGMWLPQTNKQLWRLSS